MLNIYKKEKKYRERLVTKSSRKVFKIKNCSGFVSNNQLGFSFPCWSIENVNFVHLSGSLCTVNSTYFFNTCWHTGLFYFELQPIR